MVALSDEADAKTTEKEEHHYARASLLQFMSPDFQTPKQRWKTGITAVMAAKQLAEPNEKEGCRNAHRGLGRGESVMVDLRKADSGHVSHI